MDYEVLKIYQYWIRERSAILDRRNSGASPPWTADPILSNFRFCNVRREDDKVTIWIKKNIREPYAGNPNLFLMLCIARLINWPPTLEFLKEMGAWPTALFDPLTVEAALISRVASGQKCWTGAYLLGRSEGGRPRHFAHEVLYGAWWAMPKIREALPLGLQATHATLCAVKGWGNFLSYQVVVDTRFTPLLSDAPDVHCWAAAGPGTCLGLNYLHGRDPRKAISQKQALKEMLELEPHLREVGVPFDFSDVPNILCEGSKYVRVSRGGRMRSRYKPPVLLRRPAS